MTESLRLRGEGKYLTTPYAEIIHPPRQMGAEEIVADIVSRAGLEVVR